ncbi:MAG: 23S rRNA (guanosine(2251)-2'-O)-methyltransferase RlmB [bacterium]
MAKSDARKSNLIAGIHAVEAALQRPGQVLELWTDRKRQDRRLEKLLQLAGEQGIRPVSKTRQELDEQQSNLNHQGVIAWVRIPETYNEEFLHARIGNADTPPFLLILDGVQDPHNLGACLRTADAAGVDLVIVPKDKSVGLTATVCKVASGAAETVPLVQVTNLARTLRWLRDEAGVWIVGTAGESDTELFQADLKGPLALVMGSEGKGMRRLTREHCDVLVKLPMAGSVESLNVSVATGICLFEAVRQRGS